MENVIEALQRSWARMMELLFQPFNGVNYLLFTLVFLFADCGSTHSFNGNTNIDTSTFPTLADLEPLTVGIGATVVVVALGIGLVLMLLFWGFFLFLSSQATMMSIAGIRDGVPRFEAMGDHGPAAMALWRFRLVLMLISTAWVVGIASLVLVFLFGVGLSGPAVEVRLLSELAATLTLLVAVLVPAVLVGFVDWLAVDLAAPVMMETGGSTTQAFRTLRDCERFQLGDLLLYVLARVVIAFLVAVVSFPISLLCCCAFLIPGIRHAVFLPILVFQRSTSMQWLAGLDPKLEGLRGPSLDAAAP